ncbi:MAG: hypothetical protein HND57_06530 [Planctomycetes bacterium]|nr:hypothetical protein [Planctomycetota bacterium]
MTHWIRVLVNDLVNDHQMSIDEHLHYYAYADVGDWVEALVDPPSEQNYCETPASCLALEWGPRLQPQNNEWWTNDGSDQFPLYFTEDADEPDTSWDDFVREWEFEQYGQSGFQFYDVLAQLEAYAFLTACYGPTTQRMNGGAPVHWNLASLRTDELRLNNDCNTCKGSGDDPWFSTLLTVGSGYNAYENAAGEYQIDSFDPHPDGCDCGDVCYDDCTSGN